MNEPTEAQKIALNIRIAELCGWREWSGCEAEGRPDPIPDYTGSLDAMHEAEKAILFGLLRDDYTRRLEGVMWDGATAWNPIFAEAWQRATALDRTLSEKPIL